MCYISSSRQLLVSNDLGNVLFVNSQNAASFCKLNLTYFDFFSYVLLNTKTRLMRIQLILQPLVITLTYDC